YGRYFPPDPSGASVTTIGSMLALDAAGAHSVRVGSTRDHVESLEVVLADGQCLELGDELVLPATADSGDNLAPPTNGAPATTASSDAKAHRRLVRQLADVLSRNAGL